MSRRVRNPNAKTLQARATRDSAYRAKDHPREHATWAAMLARCYNPNVQRYPHYGGRGIGVCARWRESFPAFYEDMGPKPPGLTLGRIDHDADYSPDNCRWESWAQQARNKPSYRRVEIDGQLKTPREWAEANGLSMNAVYARIRLGWDWARALTTPLAPRKDRQCLALRCVS